jgi:hypothetical protein
LRANNDQRTRSPGARYWIPDADEWLKAMHFDGFNPQRGRQGWMNLAINAETLPFTDNVDPNYGVDLRNFGPPGTPGAVSGDFHGQNGALGWPVASYPNAQSPWGLFDGAGGVAELTEIPRIGYASDGSTHLLTREAMGAWFSLGSGSPITATTLYNNAALISIGPLTPNGWDGRIGLRIASIPTPSVFISFIFTTLLTQHHRRRYAV